MAKIPVGIPDSEIIRTLAGLKALGEIMQLDQAVLDPILARARAELELKEKRPIVEPNPTPPLLNP